MTQLKQILVATDLAPCATNALQYAIQWANKQPARIHVYHRIAGMPADEADTESGHFAQAINAFKDSLDPWEKQMNAADIAFKLVCTGGSLMEGISSYIEEQDIDYLFIGSHGMPAGRYQQIGAHAVLLAREIDVPVLIAKETFRPGIKHVIFASNFDRRASHCFSIFLDMIAPFTPAIHLLNIDTPAFFSEPKAVILPAMQALQEQAVGFDCTVHFHSDSRVDRGVLDFAEEIEADLVALGEYSDRLIGKNRLHKPVKSLIRAEGLPVLLIDSPASNTS